jgi:hypothetical protein
MPAGLSHHLSQYPHPSHADLRWPLARTRPASRTSIVITSRKPNDVSLVTTYDLDHLGQQFSSAVTHRYHQP